MLERLYRWTLSLAGHPRAGWALGIVAFCESSFFPLPPDILLIPLVIARRDKAWHYAAICLAGSVLGGILGYAIGAMLYDTIGQYLIHLYGLEGKATEFHDLYARWGLWVILIKGLTPIPFKLVTIVSGLAHFNFAVFIAASIVTRGLRFFIVAGLLRRYGESIQEFIERRLSLVLFGFLVLVIGGYALLRFI